MLQEDAKVFVRGRVSVEEDKDAKLICEQMAAFDEANMQESLFKPVYRGGSGGYRSYGRGQSGYGAEQSGGGQAGAANSAQSRQLSTVPAGIWVQFPDLDTYNSQQKQLLAAIADSDGNDDVVIFLRDTKGVKVLPPNLRVSADEGLKKRLSAIFGEQNVKVVTKPIEKR